MHVHPPIDSTDLNSLMKLTQVVRVLNSHLTQLQQIDQGATALKMKVQEAQRIGQSFAPLTGPTSDAADGFYRSYMGRR